MATILKEKIELLFHGPYSTDTIEGREKERMRCIMLTAITAALAKIIAMITPLITVRITLTYMGQEIYGLWSTVISFFALFTFADLGLGSGLQTELSQASVNDNLDYQRKMISSTYIMLLIVSVILFFVFIILYPIIDWAVLINAQTRQAIALSGSVVMAIFVSKILNVPFSLITRTQNAYQEGYKSNLWQCMGNFLSLFFVIVISKFDLGIMTLIWASSLITVIVAIINSIIYFHFQKPELSPKLKYVDKKVAIKLLLVGISFFVLSIFTSFSLSIDNFIVARTCGLVEVTPYSILYKIISLLSTVIMMLSTPLWSANGEAIARKEYKWIKKTTFKISLISFFACLFFTIIILIFLNPIVYILSSGEITVSYKIAVGMCLLQILISLTSPFFMVLNASRIIKFQIGIYFLYSIISFILKYVLALKYGAIAIVYVGFLLYFFMITIPVVKKATMYLDKCIYNKEKLRD